MKHYFFLCLLSLGLILLNTTTGNATQPVTAWGDNSLGQLGRGDTTNRSLPVTITNSGDLEGKTISQIALGEHTLALCSDGSVVAWGRNDYGQLGTGVANSQPNPNPRNIANQGALAGKTVLKIAASHNQSFALCSDNSIVAWGGNFTGGLGNGNTAQQNLPVAMPDMGALSGKTVTQLVASDYRTFALCSDGTLATWGEISSTEMNCALATGRKVKKP